MMTVDHKRKRVAPNMSNEGPSLVTRALHWTMAGLVVLQGLLGFANLHIAWFLRREMAGIAVHEQIGLAILLLAVLMMLQRLVEGRRSGHGVSAVQARLAAIVHAGLYLLILAESFLGIWMMGLTGMGLHVLFWHFGLPITPDPRLVYGGGLLQLHAFVAGLLATLIIGHAMAALHHHYVVGDDVLRRMLPWRPRTLRAPIGATPVADVGDR